MLVKNVFLDGNASTSKVFEDTQRGQYNHKKSGMDTRDGGLQKALKRASQKKIYFGREYQHEQDP